MSNMNIDLEVPLSAKGRVRSFLDARAKMGANIDHDTVLTVGVDGELYALTTVDLRELVEG